MQHHSLSLHKEVHNLFKADLISVLPEETFTHLRYLFERPVFSLSPKSIDAENHTTRTLLNQWTPKIMPQELSPKSNDAENHGKRRAAKPFGATENKESRFCPVQTNHRRV
jgi:hypothetical protein